MKIAVSTPEGARFNLRLAGPFSRLLAWLIDAIIIQGSITILGQFLLTASVLNPDFIMGLYLLATFVLTFGYSIAMEWLNRGQSIGKRILSLQVVDLQGLPLSFSQIFIRNILRAVDTLPAFYLVGGISVFASKHCQRLGDLAARTIVIQNSPLDAIDPQQANKGKFNSMQAHRRCSALLRQKVSPEQAGLALEGLMRRDSFDPNSRVTLFRSIRNTFEQAATFPDEATFGLSDEQYVRNAVEILFNRRS